MIKFYVSLACNDPRNGNPTGYVDQIQVRNAESWETALDLSGRRLTIRKFYSKESKKPREVSIGHITLRIHSYSTWVGNWCWDEVVTDADNVVRLLAYLQRRGWQCEQGLAAPFDKWQRKELITVDDLTAAQEVSA